MVTSRMPVRLPARIDSARFAGTRGIAWSSATGAVTLGVERAVNGGARRGSGRGRRARRRGRDRGRSGRAHWPDTAPARRPPMPAVLWRQSSTMPALVRRLRRGSRRDEAQPPCGAQPGCGSSRGTPPRARSCPPSASSHAPTLLAFTSMRWTCSSSVVRRGGVCFLHRCARCAVAIANRALAASASAGR